MSLKGGRDDSLEWWNGVARVVYLKVMGYMRKNQSV